jgi:hypothetical protein
MPRKRRAARDVRAKLDRLLKSLITLEYGSARVANLHDGLLARHIDVSQVRKLIAALPSLPSDDYEIYSSLCDYIQKLSDDLYFRRPSPPTWDRPIALVIELKLVDEAPNFHLFSEEYITRAQDLGNAPGRQLPVLNAEELADLLKYIREGLANGLEHGLGAPGRVVFLTPVDEVWEGLTASRFCGDGKPYTHPGPAGSVCDFLGLPYQNTWLVELRSRLKLSEIVERDKLTLAAPTVIEAWRHDYYRHWPRDQISDRWGRTLFVGRESTGDDRGLPEAIVNRLSRELLSKAFDVSILGRVTARDLPRHEVINAHVVRKRNVSALLQQVVTRIPP